MRCSYYEILISTYADGELSELDLTRVVDHIECCDKCRQIYEETRTLQRDITVALMDFDEMPDMVSKVISKTRSSRINMSSWLWAAAAIFALIAIFAHISISPNPDTKNRASRNSFTHNRVTANRELQNAKQHTKKAAKPALIATERKVHPFHEKHTAHVHIHKSAPVVHIAKEMLIANPEDAAEITVEYVDDATALVYTPQDKDLKQLPLIIPDHQPKRVKIAIRETITQNEIGRYYQQIIINEPENGDSINQMNEVPYK